MRTIPLRRVLTATGLTVAILAALAACGGGGGGGGGGSSSGGGGTPGNPSTPPVATVGPAWYGYARDAQHSDLSPTLAQGGVTAQNLGQIAWEVQIDTNINSTVPIHYGSPMITPGNTVLVAVKTQTNGDFVMQAHSAAKGALVWSAPSDYVLPPHGWIPSFGSTLTPTNRLYMPGSGGKVFYTDSPDSSGGGTMKTAVFYGAANYASASATFDSTVYINTPITSDASGNIFFGFVVTGSNPAGLSSGFARVAPDGTATWVPSPTLNNPGGSQVVTAPSLNAAPGISSDGKTVYVSIHGPLVTNTSDVGFLLALDSTTLATKNSVRLLDPVTGNPAWVSDDATASPVIGPDGDVYYGVLESNFPNHNARGWLLHFDATLAVPKTPGSFGWDDTPSIVPASLVASYHGSSSYLLMSKYNNYVGTGTGDGKNKMAILDPNALETDPVAGNAVMNEVLTVLGPTADTTATGFPGAVREWCVNSAAVDPNGKAIFINSEDGKLYRWDLTVGTLTQSLWLDNGYGQAYTPTAIGPDGTVYSINASTLIAVTN